MPPVTRSQTRRLVAEAAAEAGHSWDAGPSQAPVEPAKRGKKRKYDGEQPVSRGGRRTLDSTGPGRKSGIRTAARVGRNVGGRQFRPPAGFSPPDPPKKPDSATPTGGSQRKRLLPKGRSAAAEEPQDNTPSTQQGRSWANVARKPAWQQSSNWRAAAPPLTAEQPASSRQLPTSARTSWRDPPALTAPADSEATESSYRDAAALFPRQQAVVKKDPTPTRKEPQKQQENEKYISLPSRPDYSTNGNQIRVYANYFTIKHQADTVLYRYRLDTRSEDNTKLYGTLQRSAVESFIDQHLQGRKSDIATDFKKFLVSPSSLEIEPGTEFCVNCNEPSNQPHAIQGTRTVQCFVTVEFLDVLKLSDLIAALSPSQTALTLPGWERDSFISSLNIIFGHHLKSLDSIVSVSTNVHYRTDAPDFEKRALDKNLEAVRGYFLSVRPAAGNLLLNVQVKPAAFWVSQNLNVVLQRLMSGNYKDMRKVEDSIKGMQVKLIHINGMRKVCGFAHRDVSNNVHEVKRDYAMADEINIRSGGAPETLASFFGSRYGALAGRSIDTDIAVNIGTVKNPDLVPASYCEIVKGNVVSALLEGQSKSMINFAVRHPGRNVSSIINAGMETLRLGPGRDNPTLAKFKLNIVDTMPIAVKGRQLAKPRIEFKGGVVSLSNNGSWMSPRLVFNRGARLSEVVCVWVHFEGHDGSKLSARDNMDPGKPGEHGTQADKSATARFSAPLGWVKSIFPSMGLGVPDNMQVHDWALPKSGQRLDDNLNTRLRNLSAAYDGVEFVLFIIESADKTLYSRVKYHCDLKFGIAHQCVSSAKFLSQNAPYFRNLALKVNLKLGGTNQKLARDDLPIIKEGKTMVVGLDVTHRSPGSTSKAPSIAAMVASVDRDLAQWPSVLAINNPEADRQSKEIVDDIKDMMKSRLELWKNSQGADGEYPENILIYRDGVSESQYQIVLSKELAPIQEACREVYDAASQDRARITLVVVGKRHHSRFYVDDLEAARTHKKGGPQAPVQNPPPGTVVDNGVTGQQTWDFYLQSHFPLQGTARPAHYVVLADEIFRGTFSDNPARAAACLESVTYALCFLYGRSTSAVSYCTPAYYADRVCDRARFWFIDQFSPNALINPTREPTRLTNDDVVLPARIRDTMYYI